MYEYKNTLAIGNTKLIKLSNNNSVNSKKGNIFAKLELNNPTGSHKDRESMALISYCLSNGIKEIGCASTGNFGISLAYISGIFKINCHVWVSEKISPFREAYLNSFSAIVHKVKGDLKDIYQLSSEEMQSKGIYDANPGGNLIKIEANKAIIDELNKEQLNIDAVITCINNGTHYLGLTEAANYYKLPVHAVYTHDSRAKSIKGFNAYEGLDKIKNMMKNNKGNLFEASFEDINLGLQFSKENGIIIEAASAAVLGLAIKLSSKIDNICCIITGSGLKYPEEIMLSEK